MFFDLSALIDQINHVYEPKAAQRDVAVESIQQSMVGKTYQVAPDNRISAHSPRDIISKASGRANQDTIVEHDNTYTHTRIHSRFPRE